MTNDWISTDEGLPKDGQLVIAYDDKMHHCRYDRGQFYRHTEPSDNDRIISYYYTKITHWQPELEAPNQVNKISSNTLLADSICPHPMRSREYYNSVMFKCYECGKIQ